MARNKDAYRGWVLKRGDNDKYVSSIISNGNPSEPVVYYTDDIQEARAFLRFGAAEARAEQLGLLIAWFTTDDNGKRIEKGLV